MKSESYRRASTRACAALLACLACLLPSGAAAAGVESLRVLSTQPAVFDYLLASVVTHSGEAPVLAFNHRSGRTFFLKVGDALAGYRVASFDPRRQARFNPAVNATLDEDASVVTLTKPDGTALRLVRGAWLPQPGRMATLVCLETTEAWNLQEGDPVLVETNRFHVSRIEEDWLVIGTNDTTYVIPAISEEERGNMAIVRQEVQRAYKEQRQEAFQRAREETERRTRAEREEIESERERERNLEAARAEAAALRPRLSIAITDYFLPPACRTIPFVYALPGGRIRISYMVVPSYIETRFCPRPYAWR